MPLTAWLDKRHIAVAHRRSRYRKPLVFRFHRPPASAGMRGLGGELAPESVQVKPGQGFQGGEAPLALLQKKEK